MYSRLILTFGDPKYALFDTGQNVNKKLKVMSGEGSSYSDNNTKIEKIKRASSLPSGFSATINNTISASTSKYPIHAWYNSGTIYYYSVADKIFFNKDSSSMFYQLGHKSKSVSLNISTWNTSGITSISSMFASACSSTSNCTIMIPQTNGNGISNTTARLYGEISSTYTTPPSGRSFTLAQ